MNENEGARWNREFKELGPEKIRGELILGRWDKEKRSAARQWLERADARSWQATRPSGSSRGTFFLNTRNAKWWAYVAGGFVLLLALMRVWRKW